MSKLILIGLAAAAALGIGGTVLPTEKSSHDPTETAGVEMVSAAQAQPVASLVSAVVDDPFDRSAALCATGQYMCITLRPGSDRVVTVSDMIPSINSWEEVKTINNWHDGRVTLDTVVPVGTTLAFRERT